MIGGAQPDGNLADCPPETPASPAISPFQFMAFATITIGTVMNIINVVNSNNNDNNNNNNNNLNSDNVNNLGGRSISPQIEKCYNLQSASCIVGVMKARQSLSLCIHEIGPQFVEKQLPRLGT